MPYIEVVADSKAHAEARARREYQVEPTHTRHAGRSRDGRNQYQVFHKGLPVAPAAKEVAVFQGIKFVGDDQIDTITTALSQYVDYVCSIEDASGVEMPIVLLAVNPSEGITYRVFDEDLGDAVGPEVTVGWDDRAFVWLHVQ